MSDEDDIRIPFVLLLHRKDSDYEFNNYVTTYRRPSNRIASLEENIMKHLSDEHNIGRAEVEDLVYFLVRQPVL